MKKLFINLLIALAIGAIFIAMMFASQPPENVRAVFRLMDYRFIALAFLCVLLLWLTGSISVHVIKKGMIGKQKDPGGNFLAVLSHEFTSAVTPFASGGQPALIYTLTKKGLDAGIATTLAVIRSFLYMILELILAFAGFLLLKKYILNMVPNFYYLFIPASIVCITIVFIQMAFMSGSKISNKVVTPVLKLIKKIFPKKHEKINKVINESLVNFKQGAMIFRNKPRFWVYSGLLQIVELLLIYIVPVFMLRAIEGTFDNALSLLACACISSLIAGYSPTPGSAGGAEAVALLLIGPFFPTTASLTVVFIWRIITYYFKIIAGGAGFMVAIRMRGNDGEKIKVSAKEFAERADHIMHARE